MARQYKYLSDESAVPTRWYNIVADLPNPPSPPLHPGTGQPLGPADLAPLFPNGIIEQEVSGERWLDIPEPVLNVYGASVVPSPSMDTNAGRTTRERDPDSPGSLGIAISEAVEDAATREDTSYALGSVLNHVCLHQTVIGLEAKAQMESAGEYPDVVIGCCGGGSNLAGIGFPFLRDKIAG